MKKRWTLALLIAVMGVGVFAAEVLATPNSGLTTTTVAQAPLPPVNINSENRTAPPDGVPTAWRAMLRTYGISDLYVVENTLAPGGTTGWHSHPGPSLIIVVSGSVTNYSPSEHDCAGHTYAAGASFIDAGGKDVHMLQNNGATPAQTVAVQFIPHGQPRRIDEPQPTSPNCPS